MVEKPPGLDCDCNLDLEFWQWNMEPTKEDYVMANSLILSMSHISLCVMCTSSFVVVFVVVFVFRMCTGANSDSDSDSDSESESISNT